MSLLRILSLGVCCSCPLPRCHFPGAPLHIWRWQLSFPKQLSCFSAFHKHTLLYFCSAVTNRDQTQNIPLKFLHLLEDRGICVSYRAGADFKPTAENHRQAQAKVSLCWGKSGVLPTLTVLDIADNELGDLFEGTVIHIFRSQGHMNWWGQQKKV